MMICFEDLCIYGHNKLILIDVDTISIKFKFELLTKLSELIFFGDKLFTGGQNGFV